MQLINHKNTRLTICQRFFIEKALEMLYLGTIDSYRVRLHNPKTVLEELRYCLREFKAGRIKHFQTIRHKDKSKKALVDECLQALELDPNYLHFSSVSPVYLKKVLENIDEMNYLKVISSIDFLIKENSDYLSLALVGLKQLIDTNDSSVLNLEKIDTTLNIVLSELISMGFSKGYLYKITYGIFVNTLTEEREFDNHFRGFEQKIIHEEIVFNVTFRMDTTEKVYDAITAITSEAIILNNSVEGVELRDWRQNELLNFNTPSPTRKFLQCTVSATDYLAALKKARSILSEYLDVINLGLSDEFLHIHNRVLVIDTENPSWGGFQNNVNILDGRYRVAIDHYQQFTMKLPGILTNANVQTETKDKIKSAIRYLRLGNQSTEVEHKFINYWIGLEYLFSNYESQNTINRIKEHFINAHSRAYIKRNSSSVLKDINQLDPVLKAEIPLFTNKLEDFLNINFYDQAVDKLLPKHPLLSFRIAKLKRWFAKPGKPLSASEYLAKHRINLEIHFTRIYRLRNEIIHDAATNTNNEHIASNLRYYLTFILNEIIDYLHKNGGDSVSIEEYFISNEIEIGNLETLGNTLEDVLNIDCSLDFIT
ncbi:hypothetical protein [Flavobacterium psychrotrophum]|uniref:hypothetical protein n=1 Tax=Flavobacterium psychrotrophum TaxID=2294119 RepID=UPI000E31C34E|nr:hypothetical protein [Flavobacterium psychrotrophum]